MQIRDLIPWGRSKEEATPAATGSTGSVSSLQSDMNRLFDEFWSRFDRPFRNGNGLHGVFGPSTDIAEADDAIEISIELPGMDGKDIDVTLSGGVLTVRGEKKAEREENSKGYVLSERTFGSFYRSVPLPPGVDTDQASADFKNGVLTIKVPKSAKARSQVKKIAINAN